MRRLFIETDVLQEDELHSAQTTVSDILDNSDLPYPKDTVFDEIVDFAWHEADKAWEAVKRADEIYGDSGLVPLCGFGSYTGAPVVMDVMMQKAIDENVTGKSLIFLREFKNIEWDQIDMDLLEKAFQKNNLFTATWDNELLMYVQIPVDIARLVSKYKKD